MPVVNILHITDIHFGQKPMDGQWPTIRKTFEDDLSIVVEKTGPIDLIAATGDIANRAAADEYDQAFRFIQDLAINLGERTGICPVLAPVPGNHDVDRSVVSKPIMHALEGGWESFEADFLSDPKDECRTSVTNAFQRYADWVASAPTNIISIDHTGILPGDYSGRLTKEGIVLGVVGLNTAFRHVSDRAKPGALSLPGMQIQAAAGGDVPQWASDVTVGLVLTHHPPNWLCDPNELQNALFFENSPIRLHLCGHLHSQKQGSHGFATVTENYFHLGESLFGGLEYGSGETRLHGYTVISLDVQDDTCNLTYFPRTGSVSDTGAWRFDKKIGFGLPKDGDGSKVVSFKIATNNRSANGRGDSKQTAESISTHSESIETSTPSNAQVCKEQLQKAIATGSATLILGEVSENAECATLYHRLKDSYIEILRLDPKGNESAPMQQLYDLALTEDRDKALRIAQAGLGHVPEFKCDLLGKLFQLPWLRVFSLGLIDFSASEALHAKITQRFAVYDARKSQFTVPNGVAPSLIVNLGPDLSDQRNKRSPGRRAQAGAMAAWADYLEQTVIRTPTIFASDTEPDDKLWKCIESLWGSGSLSFAPPSFLVCPSLDQRRQQLLRLYNIHWIGLTIQEVLDDWLPSGHEDVVEGRRQVEKRQNPSKTAPELSVSAMRAEASQGSAEYLKGNEPAWGDILNGFAAELSFVGKLAQEMESANAGSIVLVGSTAGSGRTTAMMQLA